MPAHSYPTLLVLDPSSPNLMVLACTVHRRAVPGNRHRLSDEPLAYPIYSFSYRPNTAYVTGGFPDLYHGVVQSPGQQPKKSGMARHRHFCRCCSIAIFSDAGSRVIPHNSFSYRPNAACMADGFLVLLHSTTVSIQPVKVRYFF